MKLIHYPKAGPVEC